MEVARIERVYKGIMEASPLDFMNAPTHKPAVGNGAVKLTGPTKKREYISLMREFANI